MKYIEIKAPAKINLGLSIISKRNDGYHNLETIFYPIHDLCDKLIIEKAGAFSFECDNPTITNDKSNLIVKAVRLLEEATDLRYNVKIILEKMIPIGGGLGGGSSDAATTLVCLNEMFSLGFTHSQLSDMALSIGSDVPFFVKPKPAFGESRGEILNAIDLSIDKPILIINPNIHISTKEAFQNITPAKPNYSYYDIPLFWNNDPTKLRTILVNDFESSIFKKYPEISNIKSGLYDGGAIYASLSGSGATVYGIYKTTNEAESAMNLFPENYFKFISLPQ